MNVLFFAQSRVAAGSERHVLKSERPLTEAEFWATLIMEMPGLAPFAKTARLARDETYLQSGDVIQPDDEVAVIPPVSGG